MRRLAKPGSILASAAAAGALVLLWPSVPSALAASGSFTYTNAQGASKTSANPPDGRCIALAGAGKISNNTDTPVGFFADKQCRKRVAAVDQGDSGAVPTYGSIEFSKANKPRPQRSERDDDGGSRDDGARPSRGGGALGGLLGG